ncbi:MAG: hypothetical protein DRO40_04865 [Thermoprotei archaeon]|nr:MAG: hypothetical protein DRO40_04865 [Thermoprotei archaeon]
MSNSNISRYITCRTECPLRHLEGLAMVGFAKKFEVIDCDRKKFKKIRLILIDDTIVESQCRFEEEVKVSIRIIASYIGLYRNKKIMEELRVIKEAKQEE